MKIVLASASPRRKELLEMLGVEHLTVLPAKGEEKAALSRGPAEYVMDLAEAKAREAAAQAEEEDVVIGADTIVWFEGRVFGKPHSREQAVSMLGELSGRTHTVYTGVCVIRGGRCLRDVEQTRVHFRPIDPEEIRRYVDSGEPMDKAGAYGAQGRGAIFVQGIEGDFFNVMGLPLRLLDAMLKRQGVNIL